MEKVTQTFWSSKNSCELHPSFPNYFRFVKINTKADYVSTFFQLISPIIIHILVNCACSVKMCWRDATVKAIAAVTAEFFYWE